MWFYKGFAPRKSLMLFDAWIDSNMWPETSHIAFKIKSWHPYGWEDIVFWVLGFTLKNQTGSWKYVSHCILTLVTLLLYHGEVCICIWLFTRPSHCDSEVEQTARFSSIWLDCSTLGWLTHNAVSGATEVGKVVFTHGHRSEWTQEWRQLCANGSDYKWWFLFIPVESHLKSQEETRTASPQCQRRAISLSVLDLPELRSLQLDSV